MYIDKDILITEIESSIRSLEACLRGEFPMAASVFLTEQCKGRLDAYKNVLSLINALEVKEVGSKEIIIPRWFLENIEDTLRIQYNINLKKDGETCQDRNIKGSLNGVRKLLYGKELTGMERLEKLIPYTSEVKEVDLDKALSDLDKNIKEFVITEEFERESETCGHYWTIAKHAFLLGLKAQKGE